MKKKSETKLNRRNKTNYKDKKIESEKAPHFF